MGLKDGVHAGLQCSFLPTAIQSAESQLHYRHAFRITTATCVPTVVSYGAEFNQADDTSLSASVYEPPCNTTHL